MQRPCCTTGGFGEYPWRLRTARTCEGDEEVLCQSWSKPTHASASIRPPTVRPSPALKGLGPGRSNSIDE